jgi:hypothetical protein
MEHFKVEPLMFANQIANAANFKIYGWFSFTIKNICVKMSFVDRTGRVF